MPLSGQTRALANDRATVKGITAKQLAIFTENLPFKRSL